MSFKEELSKILKTTEDEICLISKESLQEQHISLECGHKFNYIPLYNEIIYQIRKVNILDTNILSTNQLKCPYCRHINNLLLPYQELDGVYKLYGVNSPD